MSVKSYAMMVLGCKVNDYEATYVRERMNRHFEEVSFKDPADIYLIFTCCVTNTAEAKTRKFIHDDETTQQIFDAYMNQEEGKPSHEADATLIEAVCLLNK